ncbi:MAG TPA: cyclophane-forming radical SAM peptide maturase AmcB [Chthoniobacterales bacterium]|nr:cyclophane-forming radical SAM peptide maturase AmcB [Chthoniobacterales bacterium]
MPNSSLGYSLRNIVLQPTTRCNLDCSYCYLPFRDKNRRMSSATAEKVAEGLKELATPVTIVWHGGEPLATGLKHFESIVQPFETLRVASHVEHVIQTNATLIDDGWCQLFRAYDFGVGISLDGPKHLNRNRVNWANHESFDRVIAGLERLKAHKIDFSVIAVVNELNIDVPDQIFEFFSELGCSSLGINIEEFEGTNRKNYRNRQRVQQFWGRLFKLWLARPSFKIREFSRALFWMEAVSQDKSWLPDDFRYDIFPTVAVDGDVVMLAPELNGPYANERYPSFVIGNIHNLSLSEIISRAYATHYVKDYLKGASNCQATCEYFSFCLAGSASNKFFEHGDLTCTTTTYCENGQKAVVDAVLESL